MMLNEITRAVLGLLAIAPLQRASLDELVAAGKREWPNIVWEVGTLQRDLEEAAKHNLAYVEDGVWTIMEAGHEELQRDSTDREERDDPTGEDALWGKLPYDPTTLQFETVNDPVFSVLHQIQQGMILLQPDFQRNFVWNTKRQSQLIESILMRIPLPAFYLDASPEGRLQVMDGLQRLSTLDAFCNKKTLRLTGLRYRKDLDKKTFDDLPVGIQQVILHRTRLTLHIIQSSTPKPVRFEVFSRLNSGGLTLTAQEIRHALYQGKATELLKQLAEDADFLRVTTRSINPLRMDDRECVLRFLAFHLFEYDEFQNERRDDIPNNLDDLLNRTMGQINSLSGTYLTQLAEIFRDSMRKAEAIFGLQAFRKVERTPGTRDRIDETSTEGLIAAGRRQPVSKALFEVWSVLLHPYSVEQLTNARRLIIIAFLDLLDDPDFVKAISLATGGRSAILYRFGKVQQMLLEALV